MLLTTDEHLVSRWVRAHGARRVVRVLGVGEGDANVRVTHRPEPFGYGRSVRQALHQLCRVTGANADFLRSASFFLRSVVTMLAPASWEGCFGPLGEGRLSPAGEEHIHPDGRVNPFRWDFRQRLVRTG